MNTRIQVEHPVTELVTGMDLVQWQIRVAAGATLPFAQTEFTPRGWAIECRITSEDPANGFLPSTGRIEHLHVPSGPGVRWDAGIESGSEIGLFYDPMLAKLIVHAPTRALAIARMRRALLELTIDGIETSRSFHVRVLDHPAFQSGDISIQWLERTLGELTTPVSDRATLKLAALASALMTHEERHGGQRSSKAAAPSEASGVGGAGADRASWIEMSRRDALRGS
jgi:acetyl-CoA carboxylase biotin carboxylase subunit